ncbi:unnamed protein product [Amoebophrya sp. A25]|nr:unnamed protein product [Amoebophrya sp. A25]|eukprot:GSA25T00008556001.1
MGKDSVHKVPKYDKIVVHVTRCEGHSEKPDGSTESQPKRFGASLTSYHTDFKKGSVFTDPKDYNVLAYSGIAHEIAVVRDPRGQQGVVEVDHVEDALGPASARRNKDGSCRRGVSFNLEEDHDGSQGKSSSRRSHAKKNTTSCSPCSFGKNYNYIDAYSGQKSSPRTSPGFSPKEPNKSPTSCKLLGETQSPTLSARGQFVVSDRCGKLSAPQRDIPELLGTLRHMGVVDKAFRLAPHLTKDGRFAAGIQSGSGALTTTSSSGAAPSTLSYSYGGPGGPLSPSTGTTTTRGAPAGGTGITNLPGYPPAEATKVVGSIPPGYVRRATAYCWTGEIANPTDEPVLPFSGDHVELVSRLNQQGYRKNLDLQKQRKIAASLPYPADHPNRFSSLGPFSTGDQEVGEVTGLAGNVARKINDQEHLPDMIYATSMPPRWWREPPGWFEAPAITTGLFSSLAPEPRVDLTEILAGAGGPPPRCGEHQAEQGSTSSPPAGGAASSPKQDKSKSSPKDKSYNKRSASFSPTADSKRNNKNLDLLTQKNRPLAMTWHEFEQKTHPTQQFDLDRKFHETLERSCKPMPPQPQRSYRLNLVKRNWTADVEPASGHLIGANLHGVELVKPPVRDCLGHVPPIQCRKGLK